MRNSTKLMVAGAAATGLLLSACEIPGSGPPLNAPAVVFPDPAVDPEVRTQFSGFPAIFKGTLVGAEAPEGEITSQGLFVWYDAFETTVDGSVDLVIDCPVGDDSVVIYIESNEGEEYLYCSEDPHFVTVGGSVYFEIGTEDRGEGFHPYNIRALLDDQVIES